MRLTIRCILTFALAGVLPVAGQPAGEKVIGGPYVVNVGPRSARVMWVVQTGEASVGAEPGKPEKRVPILRSQQAMFNGLKAGTTYYYDSFGGEAGKGSFKTPPAETAKFEFVVYGDTRTRHDVHRTVIASVLKNSNPDFIVHTGDLVEDGNDTSLWPIFFDIERELLRKVAFYPSLGNHERNSHNYSDYMDAPPYYSFDWGGVHCAIIDSDIGNVGTTESEKMAFWNEQTRWLENNLQNSQKADFRFVFAHHPPMTAVKVRQGDNPHMTSLELMFRKYKVQAGFFGHDHNYQHYLKAGIHYFVTGGGGAPLYDVDVPPPGITVKVERTENFVRVMVDGKKAQVQAIKPNGEIIDTAEIGQ
jgi:acid phosphatase type 7